MSRLLATSALLLALGCSGPAFDEPSPTTTAGSGLPVTDRDPVPYTPPAQARGRTGATVALAASGGEDQARRMLVALLEAVRDGDDARLAELFAEEVAVARGRDTSTVRPRSAVIQRVLIYARRGVISGSVPVDEMVELGSVEISRAATHYRGRDAPPNIRPTDLVVQVSILEAGRTALRTMLGWHPGGLFVVRAGRDARIVAM